METVRNLIAALRCSITLEIPSVPSFCICRPVPHVFEYVALLNWVQEHESCPVSRHALVEDDIVVCNPLGLLINSLDLRALENSFQLPAVPVPQTSAPTIPLVQDHGWYISLSFIPHWAYTNTLPKPQGAGRPRFIIPTIYPYNTNSGHPTYSCYADRLNLRFVNSLVTRNHSHLLLTSRRFVVRATSAISAIRQQQQLLRYVYDCFPISGSKFVLEMVDHDVVGEVVDLPLFDQSRTLITQAQLTTIMQAVSEGED